MAKLQNYISTKDRGFKDRDIGVIGRTGNPMKTGNTASQVP